MALTILEGSTFCICDELGDVRGGLGGLYAHDTRFLSTLTLTINGERPLLLSSGRVEYFSAAFYSRNPLAGGLDQDSLSIARHRFVGDGLQDHVVIRNETRAPLAFTVELDFGTDFADIISVKQHDFALGDPLHAPELPPPAEAHFDERAGRVVLEEGEGRGGRTQVVLSRTASGDAGVVRFPVALAPHASWDVRIDVAVSLDGEVEHPEQVERRFGTERARVRESFDAWSLRLPRLSTTSDELRHSFDQSVADLAALRLRAGEGPGHLPAAGMPWFMTVFGRDTIITSLQTMLLGPELAISALETLAALQARDRRPHDRRRAGEDPPRAARRPGRGEVVRALLRDGRRDTAVPRAPVGGLALDGRQRARAAAPRAGAGRPCLDRRLRRPRRRRLRRVPAALRRPREPVVEGLGGLPALPRRPVRGASDRAGGGAGLRLRREAPAGRGRPPRVGRRAARDPARGGGRRAGRTLRRRLLGARPGRLLRARARSGQATGGRALLQHRPPALERHRPRGTGRGRSSTR